MGTRLEPDTLAPLLRRSWLLVGVGNDLRGDDAFGPLLARRLRAAALPALDGGAAPENLTGPIVRSAPQVLLLADAVDFGGETGELRLLPAGDVAGGGGSTHDPGLAMLLAYLRGRFAFEAVLLAVQPRTLGFGETPSAPVLDAVDRAARLFGAG